MIVPRATARRGMTLIEVMLAFAILTVGLVSIFAIINSGMKSHQRAIQETQATMALSSILADMRAEFAHGKQPYNRPEFVPCDDYPNFRYKTTILALEPRRNGVTQAAAAREFFVRVEVRWAERGDDKSLATQTIMWLSEGPHP